MTILSDDTKLRLLLEISQQIRSQVEKALSLDTTLELVLQTVGHLVPYDSAHIRVTARGHDLSRAVTLAPKQENSPAATSGSDGPQIAGEPGARLASTLEAPIRYSNHVIGSLIVSSVTPGKYTHTDAEILNFFAREVSFTIEKALLHEELLANKRLDSELEIARQVQLSLLPTKPPRLEGFDFASFSIPAQRVGGDYFDFVEFPQDNLGLVIADVVGKGMSAALIMASFRAFLRAQIRNDYAIATIFRKINNLLKEGLDDNRFVTAVYGVLDAANRVLTYCNAGHNPPLLLHGDGGVDRLTRGGVVMGVFPGTDYKESRRQLKSGDILVLYTDGLAEASDRNEQEYGTARLIETVQRNRQAPAQAICDAIVADLSSHRGDMPLQDDLTLVVVKAL
ncbi:MAG TPA: GAF domain-containing SpoIIE family protein phosphatase [Acidobacteriota bacterium]|jgi:serine phosphatase RsbU (regulator of sigma subunit)|nr:GAF domain-containing SpoIIE family protein phosphatase [Acidobacteriota bacterium]